MSHFTFIPGLNNDALVWDGVIGALADQHTGHALDVPAIDSLGGIVDAIEGDVTGGTILVGHSFGGAVAMAFADRFPERVAGLVLVCAPTGADDTEAAVMRRGRAREALDGAFENMAMGRLATVFTPQNANDPQVRAERLRGVRAYGAERYYAHNLALAGRPDRSNWSPEAIPVLVVGAKGDQVVPVAAQREFAERQQFSYVEMPDAEHMLPAEDPRGLAAAITNWSEALTTSTQDRSQL